MARRCTSSTGDNHRTTRDKLLILATLDALFEQSRDSSPEAGSLARRVGASPTAVARALLLLQEKGLVDASRARLTMPGLAAAASLRSRLGPRPPVGRTRPRRPWHGLEAAALHP